MGELLKVMKEVCCGFLSAGLGYLWGKERSCRQDAEETLRLQQTYAELDETNKHYRDDGKSGLIRRLHNKTNDQS